MRLVACSLLLLVACNQDDGYYYTQPGNGGGGFGTTTAPGLDAASNDGGGEISARVCGLSEILNWSECDTSGMDGLIAKVGGGQATVRADGSFEIPNPTGSNLVWRVGGNAQLKSLREYPGDLEIPSIRNSLYEDLSADANVAIDGTAGAIFAKVTYMGNPVVGATAELAGSIALVYYDDAAGPSAFGLVGATRADGIIWFPNVTPGTAVQFTVTPPVAVGAPVVTTVVVEAETATFASVNFESPPK